MIGRPPKPTEEKRRAGNPGKRPLPDVIVAKRVLDIKAPRGLGKYEKECWDLHVKALGEIGLLSETDRFALEGMCTAYARFKQAGDVINEFGLAALGSTGQLVEHPMVATERNSIALYLKLAEHFAATPIARARMGLAQAEAGAAVAALKETLGGRKYDEYDEIVDAEIVGIPDYSEFTPDANVVADAS